MSGLMNLPTAADSLLERLGWVLVHTLWQFTALALVAAVVLNMMPRASARARSIMLQMLLPGLFIAPALTWLVLAPEARQPSPLSVTGIVSEPKSPAKSTAPRVPVVPADVRTTPGLADTPAASVEATPSGQFVARNTPSLAREHPAAWFAWVVGIWLAGVALCAFRPALGWVHLRRLTRIDVQPVPEEVERTARRLAEQLGVRRAFNVLESSLACAPLVGGYLRPVIVLPASLISGVSPAQLEAILAHELVHIRRHDFLVNALQVLLETLFFYHPCVWWLSHRVRIEREHCCDDAVVQLLDDRVEYGRALVTIHELRGGAPALAVGADDGSLLSRIRRLAGQLPARRDQAAGWPVLAVALTSVVLLTGVVLTPSSGLADTPRLANAHQEAPLPDGAVRRYGTSLFRHSMVRGAMAVSPDESRAIVSHLSASSAGAGVVDLASGKEVYRVAGEVQAAAFTPDGRFLITKHPAGHGNARLSLRDPSNGKELRQILGPEGSERARSWEYTEVMAVGPHSRMVAVTSFAREKDGVPGAIHLVNLKLGKTMRVLPLHNPESDLPPSFSQVLGLAFSNDGRFLASGGFDNDTGTYFARLWNVRDGEEIRRFVHERNSYGVRSLAFSPDRKVLATRSHDGRMRLFEVESGDLIHTFPKDGGGRAPGTVAFSPDGQTVAAAGDSIRLYDVETQAEKLHIARKYAVGLTFTDKGRTITASVPGAIHRWDAATGKSLTPVGGESGVADIIAPPGGDTLITRGTLGDTHVWDRDSGSHRRMLGVHWGPISLNSDGRFLVTPVVDSSVQIPDPPDKPRVFYSGTRLRLYDLAEQRFDDRFPAFAGDTGAVRFVGAGNEVVSVSNREGVVRVWQTTTGQLRREFSAVPAAEKDEPRQIRESFISPDGRRLLAFYHPHDESVVRNGVRYDSGTRLATRPRSARLWDVPNGTLVRELKVSGTVVFSPDSRWIASTSGVVASAATGADVTRLRGPSIRAIAFSRDGSLLATAVSGNTIQIRDTAQWQVRKELTCPGARIRSLAFAADGTLFSGSNDATILEWDLTDMLAAPASHDPVVRSSGKPDAGSQRETSNTRFLIDALQSAPESPGNPASLPIRLGSPKEPAFTLPDHLNVMSVRFGSDDQTLVTLSTEKRVAVRTWDLESKSLLREAALQSDEHANFFLFSPPILSSDRRALSRSRVGARAVAVIKGKVGVWDVVRGRRIRWLDLPENLRLGGTRGLAVTPDCSVVAAGRTAPISGLSPPDGHAVVWNASTGEVLQTVIHEDAVQIQSLALSNDGRLLATGGQQAGTRIWNVRTGELLVDLPNANPELTHPDNDVSAESAAQVVALKFSPDGRQLALADMLTVKLVSVSSGEVVHSMTAPWRLGRCGLVYSPDGQLVARVASDKSVPIWSTQTGDLLTTLPTSAHDGSFSADGRWFAAGQSDRQRATAVWDLLPRD